jgi:endo-1,4-beta-xylanase
MMKIYLLRMILGLLWISLFLAGCGPENPVGLNSTTREDSRKASLRDLADARGLYIGVSVGDKPIRKDPAYGQLLVEEFNTLTPENALKFGPLRPSQDEYDFSAADTIIDFALEHDMRVRGHTLVWALQLPEWLTEGEWSEDQLREILHEHISTVVGRYRGKIWAWDVVNEALDQNGELANNFWLQGIGPEYIELAFLWAHEADPQAKLFYNDIGGEGLGQRSDKIYTLVEGFLADGIPVDGIGLQYHTSLDLAPDPKDVAANMARIADLGLEVHITEMDVRILEPAGVDDLNRQAEIYQDVLRVCLEAPNCTALVMWGLADQYSWIPYFFPDWGSALIFEDLNTPKPAYYAIVDALKWP